MPATPFFTPVRRDHLVAPFCPGSLLQARNGITVLVCGLQAWLDARPNHMHGVEAWLRDNEVVDGNLQASVGARRLIQAPLVDEDLPWSTWYVPTVRFPLVEHCINPKCRRLVTRQAHAAGQGRCDACDPTTGDTGGRKRRPSRWITQQVPLVLACEAGHLDDVDWVAWSHDPQLQAAVADDHPADEDGGVVVPVGARLCANPVLTYTVTSDVTAPVVECLTCGAKVDLGGLRHRRFPCTGGRPWLPGLGPDECDAGMRLLERTSTNLIYPAVRSAIYLPHGPEFDHRLVAFLEAGTAATIWRTRLDADGTVDATTLATLAVLAATAGITATAADVADHIAEIRDPVPTTADEQRHLEFAVLSDPPEGTKSTIGLPPLIVETRDVAAYGWTHQERFSHVSAVPRLAETRALVGFTRADPAAAQTLEEGRQLLWADARHDEANWLLAHRVFGEGIFMGFAEPALADWERRLAASRSPWAPTDEAPFTARLGLVHTFAHALLREAAAVCGYALPSLRERIFVGDDPTVGRYCGVLVFTADGDAFGTLGGLVGLAEPGNLEVLVDGALGHMAWCASDPVCIDPPEQLDNATPGSCHHCLLVPETSCERNCSGPGGWSGGPALAGVSVWGSSWWREARALAQGSAPGPVGIQGFPSKSCCSASRRLTPCLAAVER